MNYLSQSGISYPVCKRNFIIMNDTSGLYYKHAMIVNNDSSVINKWSFKFIDDARVIIYDHNRFIIQPTVQ